MRAHNDPIRSDTYTYDDAGNRTDRGAIVNGNWVTSFDGFTLTYDDDGNITHKVKPGLTDQYFTWNSLGQLTQATVNGLVTTYGYDGLGRRVRKTANGVTTRYLWDGNNLVVEMDANGNPIREYSYYPGIDHPHAVRRSSDGAVFYYITEAPGHVVGLVNASNQVVNSYEYEPFGVTLGQTEQVAQPFKYSAREQDAETGLYFMRARYYDPQLARFLSEDPIGLAGGINPFAYVGNDPVNATDPYGLFECEWIKGQYWGPYLNGMSVIGYMFPICWGGESPSGRAPEPPRGFTPPATGGELGGGGGGVGAAQGTPATKTRDFGDLSCKAATWLAVGQTVVDAAFVVSLVTGGVLTPLAISARLAIPASERALLAQGLIQASLKAQKAEDLAFAAKGALTVAGSIGSLSWAFNLREFGGAIVDALPGRASWLAWQRRGAACSK